MRHVFPFRHVHLDFHTSPPIPAVGADFDAEQFAITLAAASVDSVCVFARCHHGMSYYPTEVGTRHPALQRDLLGEQVAACRRHGINVTAYTTVVATVVARAAGAKDMVSGVVEIRGEKHVVLALAAAGLSGRVAYLDSVLAPARSAPTSASSPFRELDVALYASKVVDPGKLGLVSGAVPGSDGPVVSRQFQIGVDTWSLAVSAREPLIGTLATAFPTGLFRATREGATKSKP